MTKELRIVFFGTSEFAVPSLESLASSELFDVVAVVTQPDKPVGRQQVLQASPVKVKAEELGLKVWQPKSLRAPSPNLSLSREKDKTIDLIVVVAYGKIIPKEVLEIPKYGTINLHPSLLPKYRGPSPIQTAILNGDMETGVTIMLIDEDVDHGPILNQESRIMNQDDTYVTLSQELSVQGAELLVKTISEYVRGRIMPREQEHIKATYTKMIEKEDGKIDWSKSAHEIYNQWRAYQPWPWVFTFVEGKRVKIISCIVGAGLAPSQDRAEVNSAPTGQIIFQNNSLCVLCGDGHHLEILELQPEGKNILTASEFMRGYAVEMFR